MRKLTAILLAMLLTISLSACGNDDPTTESGNTRNTGNSTTENGNTQNTEQTQGKILVVYFSAANKNDVDAMSQATPMTNSAAATEWMAQYIHDNVGGDIAKIVPVKDYPVGYNETADQAKDERDKDARPAFTINVTPEDYDTIFIGYPIWWYRIPMVMDTFFETYDFSGKTIIPFNTHAGSRDGGTYQIIADYEPDATVLDGLAVSGEKVNKSESDIKEWLTGLGY